MKDQRVAIIGGGICGLNSAYRLTKRGYRVVLFEKEKNLGGLLAAAGPLERHYHHFFKDDKYLLSLLRELNIDDRIYWKPVKMGIYWDKIYPFNTPIDFFRLKFIPTVTKIRLLWLTFFFLNKKSFQHFRAQTAEKVIKKHAGDKGWDFFWEPLFKGKFGDQATKISAAWFWSRLVKRGSGRSFKLEEVGYLTGGFSILIDCLSEKIEASGGEIRTSCQIRKITKRNKCYLIGDESFDAIVNTINPSEFAKLTDFDYPEKEQLKMPQYFGAVTVILETKNKLSLPYWLNIFNSQIPFNVAVNQNALDSSLDRNFIYLGKYLDCRSDLFLTEDEKLVGIFVSGLEKIIPGINKQIVSHHITRDKFAQPLIFSDHRILPQKITGENIHFSTMANVFPQDRGVNEAILTSNKSILALKFSNH